jgi:pyruvate/2-oxoglutarate dehydrogenase complex dihydrolipoamide dehydrogenase (E3) component
VERFDVFVIGGGGTGSEVAFSLKGRAAGLRVGIAERDKLGGECNHYGCVPTKAMLASAKVAATARNAGRYGVGVPSVEVDFPAVMQRVRRIIDSQSGEGPKPFEEQGISVFLQEARLIGPNEIELADGTRIEADRIVLATGSEAAVPSIDGLRGGPFWTNKEAIWSATEVPSSLAVIGSGPIGLEFAQVYSRFGAEVTVVELAGRILPGEDDDSSVAVLEALEAEGISLMCDTTSCRASHGPDGWQIDFEDDQHVHAEQLLVAIGRRPAFEVHDLGATGVELNDGEWPVLDEHLRTTAERIWAAGDATGELLFTHVGSYEAELVVDDILGRPRLRDYRVVPRVTFTEPEVGSVGLTEAAARDAGLDVATSFTRFDDNERAHLEGHTFGMVKLVADTKTGEVVGGHIVGEGAGELIHQVVVAMAGRIPPRVIADTIHAYPTLSESLRSAFIELAGKLE